MSKDKTGAFASDGEALPKAQPDAVTATPQQWAEELFPAGSKGRQHPELWKHGAAAALHQWASFEHHTGAPKQLTKSDYEAALEAACKPNPTAHAAAYGKV